MLMATLYCKLKPSVEASRIRPRQCPETLIACSAGVSHMTAALPLSTLSRTLAALTEQLVAC